MKIGSFDTDASVLIVAEIGNNHEGRVDVGRELIRRAAEAGAGAVKWQTFRTERFVSPADGARFARLKSFELTIDRFAEWARLASSLGLLVIATPLDLESARGLEPIVDAFKIASGDVTFAPLLATVADMHRPMLLSSGASTVAEVHYAAGIVRQRWAAAGVDPGLAVLHCVSSYPTPASEANLAAIRPLAAAVGATPGYSDHVVGIEAAVFAVAAGARIVEKHFTLDKHFSDFRDHQLSADPADMREMVEQIRRLESMLGSGEKRIQPSEAATRDLIRRSVVMADARPAGHRLGTDDVVWLRPGGGLAPGSEKTMIGRRLTRDLQRGERLAESDVE